MSTGKVLLVTLVALCLALSFASVAEAQGKGKGGGGGGGGGGGSSGGSSGGSKDKGKSSSAPGHDAKGPGNSENAPGHDPNGPGNSENAKANQTRGEDENETVELAAEGSPEPVAEKTRGRSGGDDKERGRDPEREPGRAPPKDKEQPEDRKVPPGQAKRDEARAKSQRDNDAASSNARGKGGGSRGGGDGPDKIPAVALERASVPQENTESAIVRVQSANRSVDVAEGEVQVAATGVESAESAVIVLVMPDGSEHVLAEGALEAPWNTSAYENGFYTVEVRERGASSEGTVVVASTRVLVENPRAEAVAAVAAVATSVAVSAGAGMVAARSFDLLSMFKGAAGSAAVDTASEAASQVGEDKLRRRTAAIGRSDVRMRSAILLLSAGALLAFFKVFADREQILLALPVAFLAVFVYSVGDYAAEWSLSRASGAQTRFRIWIPGAVSLALSSVFFRSAFGYPGYVSETDVAEGGDARVMKRRAGLRALAFLGVGIALTLPFLALGSWWRWDVAEYGIGIALMMSAAGCVPFAPMPGRDVWGWSRLAWLGAFLVLVLLYLAWQLAWLPLSVLVMVGVAGAVGFFLALQWLMRSSAPQAAR